MDGLIAHLKGEISEAPFDIVDSFTVPPVGNMSLSEVKTLWPKKIVSVNLPPHLAHSGRHEVVKLRRQDSPDSPGVQSPGNPR
jgi:hypothetical protein